MSQTQDKALVTPAGITTICFVMILLVFLGVLVAIGLSNSALQASQSASQNALALQASQQGEAKTSAEAREKQSASDKELLKLIDAQRNAHERMADRFDGLSRGLGEATGKAEAARSTAEKANGQSGTAVSEAQTAKKTAVGAEGAANHATAVANQSLTEIERLKKEQETLRREKDELYWKLVWIESEVSKQKPEAIIAQMTTDRVVKSDGGDSFWVWYEAKLPLNGIKKGLILVEVEEVGTDGQPTGSNTASSFWTVDLTATQPKFGRLKIAVGGPTSGHARIGIMKTDDGEMRAGSEGGINYRAPVVVENKSPGDLKRYRARQTILATW